MRFEELSLEELELDLENPRFGLSEVSEPARALEILKDKANLKELWDSIAEKGFQKFEPLVAFWDDQKNKYIVVEGNRRLAAVKFLVQKLEDPESPGLKSIPELTVEFQETIKKLPVNVVDGRPDADDFIGFKHINGPATWGSLAKAKFAIKLFDSMASEHSDPVERMKILSRRMGDGRQLLLRMLVGYKVFQQALELEFLDEKNLGAVEKTFSHLYTILQISSARQYIGLGENPLREALIKENPVSTDFHQKLKFLMIWLFGSESQGKVIIRQGTDRPKLGLILAHPTATKTLEATGEFDVAAAEAGFGETEWVDSTVNLSTVAKKVSDGANDLSDQVSHATLKDGLSWIKKTQTRVENTIHLLEIKLRGQLDD